MQTTVKKSSDKAKSKTTARPDSSMSRRSTKEEEILKRGSYNLSTPRPDLQKSSTADIYLQKRNLDTRAPKKVSGTTHKNESATPSKDFLKSSPSSISQLSTKSYEKTPRVGAQKKKLEPKIKASASLHSAKSMPRTAKDLPFSNVTVNSPIARRKLNVNTERSKEKVSTESKKFQTKEISRSSNFAKGDSTEIGERQRSKTRTLDDKDVKMLTHEAVDNNAEMQSLSQKLTAKPKAFYVELEQGNTKITEKQSDEEISYEDDFESYESDFDSYHSEESQANKNEVSQNSSEHNDDGDQTSNTDHDRDNEDDHDRDHHAFGETVKESKDEEKMLDSGNFDLRDRSAGKFRPAAMEFILEDFEDDKKASLTDEGFQDMSSSSTTALETSNVNTHVDVLDRPMFINFSKSKEAKRKRKVNEILQQRAKDLLGMITLHEMSYTLFEMKPIPYDLYMATFGRSNYTQIAVQTFDDGITEEVQTEEIISEHKWTQHPIDFSKHDVCFYHQDKDNRFGKNNEDHFTNFTFLLNKDRDETYDKNNMDKSYLENPLRIYFEQKDGAGSCKMLPYKSYKKKIEENDVNASKLSKFLKKVERRVSNILSRNYGESTPHGVMKTSKFPFSKGYTSILPNNAYNEDLPFLKSTKVTSLIFSETKSNLLMTVHSKPSSKKGEKCILSLWDISIAKQKPVKILAAVNNVNIGRFKGNTDGIFVGALEDGTLHLWDLSEEPTLWNDDTNDAKTTNLVEIESVTLSQTERDREWNSKNINVGLEDPPWPFALQACSYTSSASNMAVGDVTDDVVGLEFVGDAPLGVDGARKVIGQICSLQRIGILTIWSIIQEKKSANTNLGKAFWSKMILEKSQMINLLDHVDMPTNNSKDHEEIDKFNLNSAKRRLSSRKTQKIVKKELSRPKSTSSSEFDISRPASAASLKKVLSVEKKYHQNWESGMVCTDLKIMRMEKKDTYLVAKNNGEVLCCKKFGSVVKLESFCVTGDATLITCLAVSPHDLPYFLAGTETGTVNLCSLLDSRVLLTLDCRNIPPSSETETCHADHKGRFLGSAKVKDSNMHVSEDKIFSQLPVTSVHWCLDPCALWCVAGGVVAGWELSRSDICAVAVAPALVAAKGQGGGAAILTPAGEIQIHRLGTEQAHAHHLHLFKKYVSLLSKVQHSITVGNERNRLTSEQIRRFVLEAEQNRENDGQLRADAEARNDLEYCCYKLKKKAESPGTAEYNRKMILDECDSTMSWLATTKNASKEDCAKKKLELELTCGMILSNF